MIRVILLLIFTGQLLVVGRPLKQVTPRPPSSLGYGSIKDGSPMSGDDGDGLEYYIAREGDPESDTDIDHDDEQLTPFDFEENCDLPRELFAAPLSREGASRVIRRALEILNGVRPVATRMARYDPEVAARNLVSMLLCEPDDGIETPAIDSVSKEETKDEEYCLPSTSAGPKKSVSPSTIKKIVEMAAAGKSEKAIKAKYKWYNRKYLPDFKRCAARGNTLESLSSDIDSYVLEKFKFARDHGQSVRDWMIRDWAAERARQINITVNPRWGERFKKRHRIKSLKVTEYCSRSEKEKKEEIEKSIEEFRELYRGRRQLVRPRLIWNTDQTGFNYEFANLRTLNFAGSRDTVLNIQERNKMTHSYTIQPIVSRDGRAIGKLLICMQEAKGQFGPRVREDVLRQEREYGNIKVVASTSGKMSKALIEYWIDHVLVPALSEELRPELDDGYEMDPPDGYTRYDERAHNFYCEQRQSSMVACQLICNNTINAVLLADSWGGHSSTAMEDTLRGNHVRLLRIPPSTTDVLQPLDVSVNRQFKRLMKRISERASQEGILRDITTRAGIINLHSLIWNQFGAPIYKDLIRYGWRHTDPDFDIGELTNPIQGPTKISAGKSCRDSFQWCEWSRM